MEMLSKGQVLLVNSGETVRLNCEFTADSRFNLFDNPVWWRKAQRHEQTQVNMMANVLEPFESTRRFTVAFQSRPPDYTLRLTIAGQLAKSNFYYTTFTICVGDFPRWGILTLPRTLDSC